MSESWISPSEVLEVALSLIEPDGSVFWNTTDEDDQPLQVVIPPHRLQDTQSLQPDVYARQILFLAREIHSKMGLRRVKMEDENVFKSQLWSLAHYLTAFRHDQVFLDEALSLLRPDDAGRWVIPPRLPEHYTFELFQKRRLRQA
jgi:hypothetical protein